jgi:hypothetical protein
MFQLDRSSISCAEAKEQSENTRGPGRSCASTRGVRAVSVATINYKESQLAARGGVTMRDVER